MPKAVVVPIKPKVPKSEKANRGRRRTDQLVLPTVAPPPKGLSKKKLIEESRRWLAIINAHKLNDYKRRKIVTDTLDNFASYYNKGYLEYRKSVTEGGEFAAIEWSGRGSLLRGHHRPPLHRLPGRLRHLFRGHQPPQDRARGEVAARAHAAQLAGAARPAARRARRAPGRAGAGRPAGLLLHQQRHGRHRGRHEAGAPLHRQARLHLLRARLPRQVLRRAVAHGQGRVPAGLRAAAAGRLLRALRRRGRGGGGAAQGGGGGHGHRRGGGRSPCRARRARSSPRPTTGRGCARSARATACCSSRTRCRRAWAARAGCSRSSTGTWSPTSSAWARRWAAASCRCPRSCRRPRSGRCWSRTRSSTPRPSAATRWPARPASPRST